MLLPLLVLFIVLAGFYPWRSVCPLAAIGELGRRLPRRFQRRVPDWLERGHLVVPFVFLASMLVLRHVASNGDGRWIAGVLIGLALAAVAANAIFTGKTWCNFFCPVGVVERIYTDPSSLLPSANSQCVRCTACKKSCPDIDQENNYWRELTASGRRLATYAFPGVVFAFYWYFWLREGDWEAYFDGRWTRRPADAELAFGSGFFFAPGVPAVVAAAATLALCAVASFAIFRAVEAASVRKARDPERRRHMVLSVAAFTAFSLFYLYAGAPTLRKIPGGTRAFAFLAPAIGVLVLARRSNRSRETYVRERGAARLLRNWPFAGEPPRDPMEAYARAQASEEAREQLLAGYTQTLRDVVADGLVDESEVRMLAEIRKQFGVTPREHEQATARLPESDRKLLASGSFVTVEERLQLESYGAALTEALLRSASEAEIELLRREFGVGAEDHATIVERMRSSSGPLLDRARRELIEALVRRADRETLATIAATDESVQLLGFLLARAQVEALGRVYDLLATVGDRTRIAALRPGLQSPDPETRRLALAKLAEVSPETRELLALLERLVPEPAVPPAADPADVRETLARLIKDADPFARAAAAWSLGVIAPGAPELLEAARDDSDPLVTEAAAAALVPEDEADRAARSGRFQGRTRISRMQFLRGVPLFAALEPRDLLDLAELSREEELPAGRPLCEEGVPDSGDLFVILAGRAAVLGDRGESELAELGPGEIVGELSLLDGSPRSATVVARGGPLTVLRIPAEAFRDRLLPRGSVSRSLLVMLTARLRALASRVSGAGS
ncbi:MAG TPA: cyclic nucleotide-binding domain-containing protein [Thermoanaerobaculia bacterium]|nr:cyclic nucleotide-binding domain-containing protein [Thermoanaerobaculia bacterium]